MTPIAYREAILEALAARLDLLMAERELTQADVFLRAQGAVAPSTIGNVLRARDCRLSTLITIATALDCDLDIKIVPHLNTP